MSHGTPVPEPDLLAALRADLAAADFTVDGVATALGPLATAALDREQVLPADLATRDTDDPVAVLVRLFALGRSVTSGRLGAAMPTVGVDGLERLGLVAVEGGRARATCDLRPYADEENGWWLASDLSEAATNAPLARDHVLGIGGASTTLASWTPRPVVATALDLGTGCGVQSVHLAAHAGSVTATDLSSRALGFAQFNAALNGSTWELLRGSLLEPVAGRRFDLVVSNPPFVITPRVAEVPLYEYRDGGAAGDAFVQGLVLSLADHLEPGGIAQLLGNWEIGAAAPSWRDRVDQWLDGTGLDAWVVQRDQQDPAQYAETWARDGGHQPGTDAFDTMYTAWLADFAARGVVAIGFGVVTLQRPETPREPWRDLMEVTGPVASPMGPAVLAGVRARTWLAEHDDEAVLSTAWRCAEDVTEERHGRPGDADPSVILLRQGGGLRRAIRLDTVMAALVSVCDGELTAGQALAAIASLMGADTEQVRGQALPVIRELVADGLLVR
jgi:methylase of polypeptide subunit release factors